MSIIIEISIMIAILFIAWKGIESLLEFVKQSCLLVAFIALVFIIILLYQF